MISFEEKVNKMSNSELVDWLGSDETRISHNQEQILIERINKIKDSTYEVAAAKLKNLTQARTCKYNFGE